MSGDDIAAASGLTKSQVSVLSNKEDNWNGIKPEVIVAFSEACGVNLLYPAKHLRYMREQGLGHLKRGNYDQRKLYQRLLKTG